MGELTHYVLLALLITSLFSGCIAASPEPEITSEVKEIIGVPNETTKMSDFRADATIDLGSVI
ncbi:MAG: hypothetical protein ABH874_03955 [Methanobacteriota archaeon]